MNNKKMIVVDLDGTLLHINQECSYRTKKYLKRLKKLGYIIVIATGRVLRSAVSVTDGAEFANYIIASAGSVVYDMNKSKIIMKKSISKDTVMDICNSFNEEEFKCINLCDLFYHYKYIKNDNCCHAFEKKVSNVNTFLNSVDDIVNVTLRFTSNDYVDKYYNLFKRDDLELLIMQDSFGMDKCLEIFDKGGSKYNAIKEIMDMEGISNRDVIAFGDGLNDVDMIRLSGIGVAMGNALSDVKDVSDYVTISHNDDGVIYFLKEYLKENNLVN